MWRVRRPRVVLGRVHHWCIADVVTGAVRPALQPCVASRHPPADDRKVDSIHLVVGHVIRHTNTAIAIVKHVWVARCVIELDLARHAVK
eukprot:7391455-Prymnesium_polylepis.3